MLVAWLMLLAVTAGGLWWLSDGAESAWQTYRRTAIAHGKMMDLPPLPPAIPDGQNFAADSPFAPIAVDAEGTPRQTASLNIDWLPLEMLPELQKDQRADISAVRTRENIASNQDEDVARAVLHLCDEGLAAEWPRVLAAEAKPQTRFGIRYSVLPLQEKLPFHDLRAAAQVHAVRAVAHLHLRRSADALDEVHGALRIGEALQSDSSLLAVMVRSAVVGLQMHVVWEGLGQGAWSDSDLAALEHELARLKISSSLARAVDGERGWLNSLDDSLVGQTLWKRPDVIRQWFPENGEHEHLFSFWCSSRMVIRDNQLMMNRQMDALCNEIDSQGNWQPRPMPFNFDHLTNAEKIRYALASFILPNYSRAERRLLAIEAWLRQARLAIAIERFRRVHGALPNHLEEVVPEFLPAMLNDPYDGAPMRFAKDAPDHFRLWSVGDDREDDGGKPDPEVIDVNLDLVWPGSVPPPDLAAVHL